MHARELGTPADGSAAADPGRGPVIVGPVQKARVGGLAVLAAGVGPRIGPLPEQSAVEPLDLAVGLGPLGTGPARMDSQFAAGGLPGGLGIGPGVIGQHPLHRHAVAGEPGDGPAQEPGTGGS
ncbi:hypothetical protein GCM10023224_11020 [Streptomonospora halophila]|uniref:Uncharacterized protein n=1 Tax=Streptomonospora halophila TaxID=427369 RepID=A0ABP9GFC1_9ACTN